MDNNESLCSSGGEKYESITTTVEAYISFIITSQTTTETKLQPQQVAAAIEEVLQEDSYEDLHWDNIEPLDIWAIEKSQQEPPRPNSSTEREKVGFSTESLSSDFYSESDLIEALGLIFAEETTSAKESAASFPGGTSTENLPDFELTGIDDPLWQPLPDEDDHHYYYNGDSKDINTNTKDGEINSSNDNESHNISSIGNESIKGDALDLLEQLEQLTLHESNQPAGSFNDWWQEGNIVESIAASSPEQLTPFQDEAWWWFCHPCCNNFSSSHLLDNHNDQAWSLATAAVLAEQEESCINEQEFWHNPLQSLAENLPEIDLIEQIMPGEITNDDKSPRCWDSMTIAQPYFEAFGATPSVSKDQTEATETSAATTTTTDTPSKLVKLTKIAPRECWGHKERVLGCEVSPCGNFCATASQDSTVRVWHIPTQKQLAILRGHAIVHECLRVAWSTPAWTVQHQSFNGGTTSCKQHAFLLATGGADGVVQVWGCNDPLQDSVWSKVATVDHSNFLQNVKKSSKTLEAISEEDQEIVDKVQEDDDDADVPQIYALQFIEHWKALPVRSTNDDTTTMSTIRTNNSFLLTSSKDYVHLWQLEEQRHKKTKVTDGHATTQLGLREVMSLRFGPLEAPGYGVYICNVTDDSVIHSDEQELNEHQCQRNSSIHNSSNVFGGERNPDKIIYVFDASYCFVNGLLGVALSDGSLRLMNGRGVCLSVLQLPGCQSHLTSLAWNSTGTKLTTTVATGHLITWGILTVTSLGGGRDNDNVLHSLRAKHELVHASCLAIMEGGHVAGRPVYGTAYLENDCLLMSWGSDGRLCLWDATSEGEIDSPLAVLRNDETFPIFAVSVSSTKDMEKNQNKKEQQDCSDSQIEEICKLSVAIAGGGSECGFLGIPVYLQDVKKRNDSNDCNKT